MPSDRRLPAMLLFLRLKVWILSSDSVLDSRPLEPPQLERLAQSRRWCLLPAPCFVVEQPVAPPSLAVLLLDSRSLVKPCCEAVADERELLEEQDERGRLRSPPPDFLPPIIMCCFAADMLTE